MVVTKHTFLFADLVGFTAYTAREGDDEAAAIALRFHAAVRDLLGDHAAAEVKTIGDAVMLRCECPHQAVRLAARLVREVGGRGGMLAIRAGVATGTAVSVGGDWFGSAVNVAARLCSAAAEGQALACEETLATAGSCDGVRLTRLGPLSLRNLPSPVTVAAAA